MYIISFTACKHNGLGIFPNFVVRLQIISFSFRQEMDLKSISSGSAILLFRVSALITTFICLYVRKYLMLFRPSKLCVLYSGGGYSTTSREFSLHN